MSNPAGLMLMLAAGGAGVFAWQRSQSAASSSASLSPTKPSSFFNTIPNAPIASPAPAETTTWSSNLMSNANSEPRGIRNNNPGNVRNDGTQWQGLAATQTDPAYYQFQSPAYGIRAMARILHSYETRDGIHTIRGIISRWAPSSENNTSAYVSAVSDRLGIPPDANFNLTEPNLAELIAAIIWHENGQQPYSQSIIRQGISLA